MYSLIVNSIDYGTDFAYLVGNPNVKAKSIYYLKLEQDLIRNNYSYNFFANIYFNVEIKKR